jgi:hypothetical protein
MAREREYFHCPHCGASVPVGAKVCRECGSDEETGWSASAEGLASDEGYDADEDFDYDEYLAREFPDQAEHPFKLGLGGIIIRIIILLVIAAFFLELMFHR